MYFSKDADSVPTFESPWIHQGWTPTEEEVSTHSSILAWRIPWTEKPAGYSPRGHKEPDATEQLT